MMLEGCGRPCGLRLLAPRRKKEAKLGEASPNQVQIDCFLRCLFAIWFVVGHVFRGRFLLMI